MNRGSMTAILPLGSLRPSSRLLSGRLLALILAVLGFSLFGRLVAEEPAQDESEEAGDKVLEGHSYHGEVFNEGPRQRAYIMEGSGLTGTGKVCFPVTTTNAEAQAFIEQGVGQLHGFWYFESERSFRQAAALDPECAMAYWGMALSNANNDKRARDFIAEAVERKDEVTERERLYIEACSRYLDKSEKDGKKRARRYSRDLENLLHEYPDDVEAKAFLVVQQWFNTRKGIPIASHLAIDALLDQIFEVNPDHPAHHYRIHLWDYERAEKALESAALCGRSAPSIAHMWHMPGHIFSRLKRYEDACWQQEASARVDHAHMMRDRILPDQIHNFAHNNEWLIRNLTHVGRVRDAIDLAKNMIELPRHPKYNLLSKGGCSASWGRQRLLGTLRRYELWDELVELSRTRWLEPSDAVEQEAPRLRALGEAHARRGDQENTVALIGRLEGLRALEIARRNRAESDAEAEVLESIRQEEEKKREKREAESKCDPEGQPANPTSTKVRDEGADSRKASSDESGTDAESKEDVAERDAEAEKRAKKRRERIDKAKRRARDRSKRGLERIDKALESLRGHLLVLDGDVSGGLELLEKAGGQDDLWTHRLRLEAVRSAPIEPSAGPSQGSDKKPQAEADEKNAKGAADVKKDGEKKDTEKKDTAQEHRERVEKAEKSLDELVDRHEGEVCFLAARIEDLWTRGERDAAAEAFGELRQLSGTIDSLEWAPFVRLAPIARELDLPDDWRVERELPDDIGDRPNHDELGPFRWAPTAAPEFQLPDADGVEHTLSKTEGPLLLIFYLGHECLHCAEQLQAFAPRVADFRTLGLEILAISTNKQEDLELNIDTFGDEGFPFPLAADPELEVFKAYRVHDDFEQLPLHGTFLLDEKRRVRWHDISYEPFMDPQFVLDEWARLSGREPLRKPARAKL